jgi:hypothetical protein
MPIKNLLFVDTNIWLDFYRARNETGLQLLKHLEKLSDRLVVTYQLEMEFKKNRQKVILESIKGLGSYPQASRPGIFSDSMATKIIAKSLKEADKRARDLKEKFVRALADPGAQDPVYKVCQRIFHKADDLVLTRDNPLRRAIRARALKRFFHGCPPRKESDTSMGDAFNWEWMLHCATQEKAGLVIVTRDSDYGITIGERSFPNDHLRQEFSERVSQKRDLILVPRPSEALKLFDIKVSAKEEKVDKEMEATSDPYFTALRDFVKVPAGRFAGRFEHRFRLIDRDMWKDAASEGIDVEVGGESDPLSWLEAEKEEEPEREK